MKKFSIRRFGLLLKLDCSQNAKKYSVFAAAVLLAHFLAQVMVHYAALKHPVPLSPEVFAGLGRAAAKSFALVSAFMVLAGVTLPLSLLETKARRIAYFLVPATGAEKFLSKALIGFVGSVVLAVAAFVCADALRMLVFCGQEMHVGSQVPAVWQAVCYKYDALFGNINLFSAEGLREFWLTASVLGINLLMWSFYFLGSVCFRKNAFIKTSLVLFAISVSAAWLFAQPLSIPDKMLLGASSPAFQAKASVLLLVLVIAYAYRRFVRMPVVSRKWLGKK